MEPDTEQVPVTCTKWPKGIQGKNVQKSQTGKDKAHVFINRRNDFVFLRLFVEHLNCF